MVVIGNSGLKNMDRYGWDIQVLLPTGNNGNFAYRVALNDMDLGAAMCGAYNNGPTTIAALTPNISSLSRYYPARTSEKW